MSVHGGGAGYGIYLVLGPFLVTGRISLLSQAIQGIRYLGVEVIQGVRYPWGRESGGRLSEEALRYQE